MGRTHLAYFEDEDILHLAISDELEAASVELSPNITAELNSAGELIGIEILSPATTCATRSSNLRRPRSCNSLALTRPEH